MFEFLKKLAGVNKDTKENDDRILYGKLLQAFRKRYSPDAGWDISFSSKDRKDEFGSDVITATIGKGGKPLATASVEKGNRSLVDVEREAAIEVLLRFGIFLEAEEEPKKVELKEAA